MGKKKRRRHKPTAQPNRLQVLAVTLEAVTVPLADGRRGVVLVLTDEYSRKTVMRAMPASR